MRQLIRHPLGGQKGDDSMNQEYFFSIFRLWNLFILGALLVVPSLSSAQIQKIFPQVDTLSLWGTCTPPEIQCTLIKISQDTDLIVVHKYGAELICGVPFGYINAYYDSAYFEVRDSSQLNRYEIFYTNYSDYHSIRFQLPFDSTIFSYPGPCKLTLQVFRNAVLIDSAVLSFDSYQTGLGVNDKVSLVPNEPVIIQNYPNPFNPSTIVSYSIPKAGIVHVEVFDLLGHRIDILVNKFQPSGNYFIEWEPRNISTGIYLIALTNGIQKSVVICQYLK
jgi:hypothetical protein